MSRTASSKVEALSESISEAAFGSEIQALMIVVGGSACHWVYTLLLGSSGRGFCAKSVSSLFTTVHKHADC
jgi:hypothetical protein